MHALSFVIRHPDADWTPTGLTVLWLAVILLIVKATIDQVSGWAAIPVPQRLLDAWH